MADSTHETKIVVNGDATKAVGALGSVKRAFDGVSKAASYVTRALGLFGLAVNGVQALVAGYKKLQEWLNRAATAAAELKKQLVDDRHSTQIALAAKFQKDLNDQLAKANRLEETRNDLLKRRNQIQRDFEDANLEKKKQGELAALDPNAADYEQRKGAIERRYASAASNLQAKREKEDAAAESAAIDKQIKSGKYEESKLAKLLASALATENRAVEGKDQAKINEAVDVRKKLESQLESVRANLARLGKLQQLAGYGGQLADARNAARQAAIANSAMTKTEAATVVESGSAARAAAAARKDVAARIDARQNRIAAIENYDAALKGAVAPSQNRLTAMGLGSGVSSPVVGLSGDVHKMLDVMKKQLALEERQNNAKGEIAALFSE